VAKREKIYDRFQLMIELNLNKFSSVLDERSGASDTGKAKKLFQKGKK
jgi:hypothetical protein